jgi:hypothetical protein
MSDDTIQPIQVYWGQTKPFFGRLKTDGQITLNTCTGNLTFSESVDGVFYLAEPGKDLDIENRIISDQYTVCGEVLGLSRIAAFNDTTLTFRFNCTPLSDEFSVYQRVYPSVDKQTHTLAIEKATNFSMFGKKPAPEPLICATQSD